MATFLPIHPGRPHGLTSTRFSILIAAILMLSLTACSGVQETRPLPPPDPVVVSSALPIPPATNRDGTFYTVRRGDMLFRIAEQFYGNGGLWRRIRNANPLINPNLMRPGTQLFIPNLPDIPTVVALSPTTVAPSSIPDARPVARTGTYYRVKNSDTYYSLAEQFYGNAAYWRQIRDANPRGIVTGQEIYIPYRNEVLTPGPTVLDARPADRGFTHYTGGSYYMVERGDTFSSLALRYYGMRSAWTRIRDANPGIDPQRIRIGTQIYLPNY